MKQRQADPAHTRNPEALDEVPHEMVAGVQEMLQKLAGTTRWCTISTGGAPRVERFLEHYGVRELFTAVIGSQTTRRMKPHPEPLFYGARRWAWTRAVPDDRRHHHRRAHRRRGRRADGGRAVRLRHRARTARGGRGPDPAHDLGPAGGAASAEDALGKTASPTPTE
jgi:hypothetical protein